MSNVTFQEESTMSTQRVFASKSKHSSFGDMLIRYKIAKDAHEADMVLVGISVFILVLAGIMFVGTSLPHTHAPTAAQQASLERMLHETP